MLKGPEMLWTSPTPLVSDRKKKIRRKVKRRGNAEGLLPTLKEWLFLYLAILNVYMTVYWLSQVLYWLKTTAIGFSHGFKLSSKLLFWKDMFMLLINS